jgi:hypothetical protein
MITEIFVSLAVALSVVRLSYSGFLNELSIYVLIENFQNVKYLSYL